MNEFELIWTIGVAGGEELADSNVTKKVDYDKLFWKDTIVILVRSTVHTNTIMVDHLFRMVLSSWLTYEEYKLVVKWSRKFVI